MANDKVARSGRSAGPDKDQKAVASFGALSLLVLGESLSIEEFSTSLTAAVWAAGLCLPAAVVAWAVLPVVDAHRPNRIVDRLMNGTMVFVLGTGSIAFGAVLWHFSMWLTVASIVVGIAVVQVLWALRAYLWRNEPA